MLSISFSKNNNDPIFLNKSCDSDYTKAYHANKKRKKSAFMLALLEILTIFVALSNLITTPQLKIYNK